jgi:predicted nucleic acid-binding protein
MPAKTTGVFFDTSVLVYTFSDDYEKAVASEILIRQGGVINVQVLNELANVARRKIRLSWDETKLILDTTRALLTVLPLTEDIHCDGVRLARRYGLSIYDAMIAAAALSADCTVLMSEDMQDGMVIDNRLRIRNPFK